MNNIKRIQRCIVVHAILIIFLATALLPILLVVINSFKEHSEIVANPLALPGSITFRNYSYVWKYAQFATGFKNSILLALSTVAIVLVTCTMGGYVLAAKRIKGVNWVIIYFTMAMTIPIQLFLFPLYYMMAKLKLVGSVIPVSFILAARNAPLSLFLMRTFFVNIPKDLEDAARIDGAGTISVLWYIMAPLVSPGLVTVGVIVGLNAWNEFLITSTFLHGARNFTATLQLRGMIAQFGSDMGVLMAGAMILIVPIMLFFLLAQKYFIDGLVSGAVKG